MICIVSVVAILTPQIYLKVVLFLNEKTNCAHKFLLSLQMIIYSTIYLISAQYLVRIPDLTDCLINLSALLIIIEFDKIFGGLFKMHLDTYYEEITNDENFMKMESTKQAR